MSPSLGIEGLDDSFAHYFFSLIANDERLPTGGTNIRNSHVVRAPSSDSVITSKNFVLEKEQLEKDLAYLRIVQPRCASDRSTARYLEPLPLEGVVPSPLRSNSI